MQLHFILYFYIHSSLKWSKTRDPTLAQAVLHQSILPKYYWYASMIRSSSKSPTKWSIILLFHMEKYKEYWYLKEVKLQNVLCNSKSNNNVNQYKKNKYIDKKKFRWQQNYQYILQNAYFLFKFILNRFKK